MNDFYNSKVIAQLRSDLTTKEKAEIEALIAEVSQRLNIISMGNSEYRMAPPVYKNNDFAPVCFFYGELEDRKEYFSRLEYFDFAHDEHEIAV